MKKYCLLLLLLPLICITFNSSGQDLKTQFQKGEELYYDGHFEEAAAIFEAMITPVKQEYGATDTSMFSHLLIITGASNQYCGKYRKAEAYFLQAKHLFETTDLTQDYGYAVTLNNLANLYDDMGLYELSEPLYKKANAIDILLFGENSADNALDLANLAALFYATGRYEQAEPLYLQAIDIAKVQLGDDDPQYALYLNNLAQLYATTEKYEEAESLLKHAIEISKIKLGENHPQTLKYLSNLANLFYLMDMNEQSELIYKQVLEITEKKLGRDHPSYAIRLNNLASVYIKTARFKDAEPLLLEAYEIDVRQLGENHPECARVLNNLARLYYETGRFEQVSTLNKKAFQVYQSQISINTGFLSEKELEQFLGAILRDLEFYQFLNYQLELRGIPSGDFAYDIELLRKGILLKSALGVKTRIMESSDTTLINAYYTLVTLRKKIDKLNETAFNKRTEDLKKLNFQVNELEKTLSLKSKDYRVAQQENMVDWKEIHKNLKPGEAAVEFCCIPRYYERMSTDTILYCAIVLLNNDTNPRMIYLCDEARLKKIIPPLQASEFKEINKAYIDASFYQLIWQPIDSLLAGIKTVYFAPSGMLNSIAFAAISTPDSQVLTEKYNLIQLSTSRTLAMPAESVSITEAVVYGGIIYETDTLTLITNARKYHEKEYQHLAYNRSVPAKNRSGFRYLPGTKKEAELITENLIKNKITTTLYTGTDALEESFMALSGKKCPSIIHLASHGYYYADTISDENRKNMNFSTSGVTQFRYSHDPLLRSGVLMAGANLAWKGLPRPETLEDGILTAKEVSNMNLMNTHLVALSACQTGQGDVKGSEGVVGLQRGFKMAGVRYLVMSLWEIPDKETTEFMEIFYDKWLGGKEIREAFRSTQEKMRDKYKNEPFKWAAFVLAE